MSGTAQIFPVVGSNFNLPNPLPTEDISDGTPGAAAPSTAIQVAGSDGTDLRTIATDGTGQVKVLIENASAIPVVDSADGTPGSAPPSTAIQIAGSDGTALRAVSTDSVGRVKAVVSAAILPVPKIVQKIGANNSGAASTTLTLVMPGNVTAGNTLVVAVVLDSGLSSSPLITVTDSQNNVYQAQSVAGSTVPSISNFLISGIASATGALTITVTIASPLIMVAEAYEVNGVGSLETVGASSLIASGTALQAVVSIVTQENCLAFMLVGCGSSATIANNVAGGSPSSLVADANNIAVTGGSNLTTVSVFSGLLGPTFGISNANFGQGNLATAFRATLSGSAKASLTGVIFRPSALPVTGTVQSECLGVSNLADGQSASNVSGWLGAHPSSGAEESGTPGFLVAAVLPEVFNGNTLDRVRSVTPPHALTINLVESGNQPGIVATGITTGPAGAVIQGKSAVSSGSVASLAMSPNFAPRKGNSVVVVCAVGNGSAPTVADNSGGGNVYKLVASQLGPASAFGVYIFYTTSALATGIGAITVTNTGAAASMSVAAYEVEGLLAIAAQQPDSTSTGTGTSTTAAGTLLTPNFPNEIVFAGCALGTGAQTITPASGWNNDFGQLTPTTPAGLFSFVSMSQFLPDYQQVTPGATFTSEPWAIAAASFRTIGVSVAGKVIGEGQYQSALPTPPSTGAIKPLQQDGYGNLFVNNLRRSQTVAATGNIASASPANIVGAQGAGIFADLAALVLTLREGTTANVFFQVLISDGTNTYKFNFLSQSVTTFASAAPLVVSFDPPLPATTANTAWTIALSSATDAPSVDYVATFVKQVAE